MARATRHIARVKVHGNLTRSRRPANMAVAGPNCMGSHSYRERLFAYPNTELCRVPAGSVGCVFQSGGTLQFL